MPGRLPEPDPVRAPGVPLGGASLVGYASGAHAARVAVHEIADTTETLVRERVDRADAKSQAELQQELNKFREEALAETDSDALDAMIHERLPKIEQQALEGYAFKNPNHTLQVQDTVSRYRESLLGHRLSLRQQDANATAAMLADAYAEDVAQLSPEDGVEQLRAMEEFRANVDKLQAMTPAERELIVQRGDRNAAVSFMERQLRDSPNTALALLEDRADLLASDPLLKNLQEEDRAALIRSARIEQARIEADAEKAQRAAAEASWGGWLERIYQPENGKLPTVREILSDRNITPSLKEHLIGLLEQEAVSTPQKNDPVLMNELFLRVHDPTRPDHITSPSQVYPYVGHGVDQTFARTLLNDMARLAGDPNEQQRSARLTEYLKSAHKQISGSSMVWNDALGESKFADFTFYARAKWDALVAQGRDPVEILLNPASPEFLGKAIQLFRPTMQDQATDMQLQLSPVPVPEPQPGEDPMKYLLRTVPGLALPPPPPLVPVTPPPPEVMKQQESKARQRLLPWFARAQ